MCSTASHEQRQTGRLADWQTGKATRSTAKALADTNKLGKLGRALGAGSGLPRSHRRRSLRPASWAPVRSDSSNHAGSSSAREPTPPAVSSPSSSRRPQSRLTRARSSLGSLSALLHSRPSASYRRTEPVLSLAATPLSTTRPLSALHQSHSATGPSLPHVPAIADLDLDFDSLLGHGTSRDRADSNRSRPPSSLRRDGRALSVLPRLRNTLGSRRRRSLWQDDENMDSIERLRRGEDQADVLSRLLSLAAAATAASLVGEDHHAATRDGTFDTFLQSLQNGSIASALRGNEGGEGGDSPGGTPAPLNFFRMFRFGTSNATSRNSRERSRGSGSGSDAQDADDSEGRMVPIIIVGIRSINPASGTGQDDGNIPPFLDALSSFPTPPTSPGDNDTLLQPQNGTRFSHRRRASMGGFSFPSNYDSQRHHRARAQDPPRPFSPSFADSPPGPQPPPSTPATNAALSADPSGSTTPAAATTPPSSTPHSNAPSRRGSFIRRSPGSTLEPTEEEESQPTTRSPRQRRLSESDFTRYGAGAPRRRGVVEPDNNPGEGSRSWIIYVLGGSYPENHPILTTPSLFTDSPTYEDMMLLSSILGPAKAPVASEGDVAAAPGLFRIVRTVTGLTAEAFEGEETIELAGDARCLVCLCDFEAEEEARKLVKCEHMFHKICIDQWLTTGRNSCPLCRGQGVDETPAPDVPGAPTPSSTPAPQAVA
ncbi:uncharacterized protein M421DRAFT_102483 [Didymella exigua CBS 183.55]|uniref:RING-type domain-containing protein n=1 Tax=Didymella exigua CBS 183.55 TaxID=1150837 RepID=A0A6A5RDT6_9PLEO|nr:uncharacterized protein M421DRAFT_102483 [Didymella exigua CBS 183.55]KAF1926431.1 hypothetical protein M421DRAFT_102483 [Didymella exigua CBS 183.55]